MFRNSKSKYYNVSSGQCTASCVFDNATKIIVRLGCLLHQTHLTDPELSVFPYFDLFFKKNPNVKKRNSLIEMNTYGETYFIEKILKISERTEFSNYLKCGEKPKSRMTNT